MTKPKILIVSDYYLPGYKSGGGMRTIVNMVERLHSQFDFWIVTRDHDGPADRRSYSDVKIDEWNDLGNARVYYLSKRSVQLGKMRELVLEVKPGLLYFNSFFATPSIYVMTLRRLGRIPRIPVVLAPCGELSDGALGSKSIKKRIFTAKSKLTGLFRNIIWKASSPLEMEEIERIKFSEARVMIAPDLPPRQILRSFAPELKPAKSSGSARLAFLSRFARKKNFKFLLEHIGDISGELTIDVIGPLEDTGYWSECEKVIKTLPANIKVNTLGTVPHEKVPETLLGYHFLVLPTLGENFGHVFLEALAAGCPLVISDRTPWLGLEEKKVGWDISLEEPSKWSEVIQGCVDMDTAEYSLLSGSARSFATYWLADPKIEEDTVAVLRAGLDSDV